MLSLQEALFAAMHPFFSLNYLQHVGKIFVQAFYAFRRVTALPKTPCTQISKALIRIHSQSSWMIVRSFR